jgi:hypothetical protein
MSGAESTSNNCFTVSQSLALSEILAQLVSRDDAVLALQLLKFLRDVAQSPNTNNAEAHETTSAITNTLASLIVANNDAHSGQINDDTSAVLVTAAKHGSPNIVEAMLIDSSIDIPNSIVVKAKNEAQQNNQAEIAEHLTQYDSADDSSANKLQLNSDNVDSTVGASVITHQPLDTASEGAPPDDSERAEAAASAASAASAAAIDLAVEQHEAAINNARHEGYTGTVALLSLVDIRQDSGREDTAGLQCASYMGDTEKVSALLTDPHLDPAANTNAAIRLAAFNGHVGVIKLLLQQPRVDPAAELNDPIIQASRNGHPTTVELFLADPRVNPAAVHSAAVRFASMNGHTAVVKLLLADPRVDPAVNNNSLIYFASSNGHPETTSVLLEDSRVNLTAKQRRDYIGFAIQNGFVDVVAILLARFPSTDANTTTLIDLCSEHNQSEILKVVLHYIQPQAHVGHSTRKVSESLRKAFKNGHHQFVLELLAESTNLAVAQIVTTVLMENDQDFCAQLASMHVDVLRVLLTRFGAGLEDNFNRTMMRYACRNGSTDVVQELLDNHQDKFGDWTVKHFNAAALHGNVPVLRLLSLSKCGGCKKLAENPPLNRICTRRVLREMYLKSSFALMWSIKRKTTPRTMARLLDVLRDLISSDLLRYETK